MVGPIFYFAVFFHRDIAVLEPCGNLAENRRAANKGKYAKMAQINSIKRGDPPMGIEPTCKQNTAYPPDIWLT